MIECHNGEEFEEIRELEGVGNFVNLLLTEKINSSRRTKVDIFQLILIPLLTDLMATEDVSWFPTDRCEYISRGRSLSFNYGAHNITFRLPTNLAQWDPRSEILAQITLVSPKLQQLSNGDEFPEPVSPKVNRSLENEVIPGITTVRGVRPVVVVNEGARKFREKILGPQSNVN